MPTYRPQRRKTLAEVNAAQADARVALQARTPPVRKPAVGWPSKAQSSASRRTPFQDIPDSSVVTLTGAMAKSLLQTNDTIQMSGSQAKRLAARQETPMSAAGASELHEVLCGIRTFDWMATSVKTMSSDELSDIYRHLQALVRVVGAEMGRRDVYATNPTAAAG